MIYCAGALMILGLFQFFGRNAFLDVKIYKYIIHYHILIKINEFYLQLTLAFSIFFILTNDCFEKLFLKILLGMTGFAIVLDIIWMYISFSVNNIIFFLYLYTHFLKFIQGLWNSRLHRGFDESMVGVYHFTCVMFIFSLLVKVNIYIQ